MICTIPFARLDKMTGKLRALKWIYVHGYIISECERTFNHTAIRFARKLFEDWAFELGQFDHLYVHLTPELADAQIEIWTRKPETWQENVDLGFSEDFSKSLDVDGMTILIASILSKLARKSGCETKAIEAVKNELLATGDDTKIWMQSREKKTLKYTIKPFFKVKGCGHDTVQVYLSIMKNASNEVFEKLIIETKAEIAFGLTGAISIKNDVLTVKPRAGMWGSTFAAIHRSRGFVVPIRVPLQSEFDCLKSR